MVSSYGVTYNMISTVLCYRYLHLRKHVLNNLFLIFTRIVLLHLVLLDKYLDCITYVKDIHTSRETSLINILLIIGPKKQYSGGQIWRPRWLQSAKYTFFICFSIYPVFYSKSSSFTDNTSGKIKIYFIR